MSRDLRFRPPHLAFTPELVWALLRAFGPREAPAPPADVGAAVDLAVELGLGPRLGVRARAAPEVPAAGRDRDLARHSMAAAASELQAQEGARAVAAAAAASGIPCCFLKGVALDALGVMLPGGRGIADVDVLAAPEGVEDLAAALVGRGFSAGGNEYAHQLAALVHPQLGCVEIHRHLPGVRLEGRRRFATLPELRATGRLTAWAEAPGEALLPDRPLLVAHLLAHGIAQHGFRPQGYPLLRMVGDLIDLGLGGEGGEALAAEAATLLVGTLSRAEVEAAVAVCRVLATGEGAALADDSDAGCLLRHLVAAHLDAGYRESLKIQDLARPLGEGSRLRGWVGAARQALWLSRAQIDAIYGRPRNGWGYAARRLWRPFDLVRRAVRAAAARR